MRVLSRALTLAVAFGLAAFLHAQNFDLVIAGGRVIDPESGLDGVRNIGISGRTIAAISAEPLAGRATINATGLVVSPGFIDLHAHGQTPETYRFQARDGVTTALELEVGTGDIERWYAERKPGRLINYGVSIGHIPVRMAVMHDPGTFLPTGAGAHKAASADEIKEIARRIEDGLSKGAVSIGAGFPYTPAATQDELLEVFRVAGRTRAPVHVHIRRGVSGLQEALKLAGADESAAARRAHQQRRNDRDARDARHDREGACAGTGRHNRGLSVHGGHDRNPVRESRRIRECDRGARRAAGMAEDRRAIEPCDVPEISQDGRSGRPPHQHGRDGERRRHESAHDDRQRRVLGKRHRPSSYEPARTPRCWAATFASVDR